MNSVLVAMFDSQQAAASARERLISAGFPEGSVTLTGAEPSSVSSSATWPSVQSTGEEKGPIARFFDHIFGDDDDVSTRSGYTETYNEAFRRGSYGVTVTSSSDQQSHEAETILNECGAIDIDEKAQAWRNEGWSGGTATALQTDAASATPLQDAGTTRKLQEVQEELKVGKRAVSKGSVRVFSRTSEVPVEETVRLREEHAQIQRVAVDRPATEADLATAFKEGSIEVREMDEEAVVSKTARVTGEVEIGKTATEREETIRDTVRQTKVDVEQVAASTGAVQADALRSNDPARDPTVLSNAGSGNPAGSTMGKQPSISQREGR